MQRVRCKSWIGASAAFLVVLAADQQPVLAGGFGVETQSTTGLGSAFAGVGTGGDLSSVFWNSAAVTAQSGKNFETHATFIHNNSEITVAPDSTLAGGLSQTVDVGRGAVVAASYVSQQINDIFFVGIGINSPFGLSTEAEDRTWAGQYHSRSTRMLTANINPVVGLRVLPSLALGFGAQVQWMELSLRNNPSFLGPNANNQVLKGDDISVGFTAGLLWQPTSKTVLGLGYRSAIDHTLKGVAKLAGNFPPIFVPLQIEAKLTTPDSAMVSFRQELVPNVRLLGFAEWLNWSLIDTIPVIATSNGGPNGLVVAGTTIDQLDFNWHDGWFFSLGTEVDYSSELTLRAGIAYEVSPVQNPTERSPAIPDADRWHFSLGASYRMNERVTLDIGYSHIRVKEAGIRRIEPTLALGNVTLAGSANTSVNLLGVSMRVNLSGESESSE